MNTVYYLRKGGAIDGSYYTHFFDQLLFRTGNKRKIIFSEFKGKTENTMRVTSTSCYLVSTDKENIFFPNNVNFDDNFKPNNSLYIVKTLLLRKNKRFEINHYY